MTEGTVVTFYSYKGGVGRTLALANIGTLLSKWGFKVLCVDWDLEAPGLQLYFENWMSQPDNPGVVDLIIDYVDGKKPKWQGFVAEVKFPGWPTSLSLINAGRLNDEYPSRMQSLNWAHLYEQNKLGSFIEQLRDEWKANFDFILIDSRTGMTDIGGICTVQLPDILVSLFTANKQNLQGSINVLNNILRARNRLPFDRAKLWILPIATRFELRVEYELAEQWLDDFAKVLTPFYSEWTHKDVSTSALLKFTRIPYIPFWSFGEKLPVIDKGTGDPDDIGFSFESLAALIAHKLADNLSLISDRNLFIAKAQQGYLPPDLLPRARQILLPLVATVEEREALLTEAFYLHEPLLYAIDRQGASYPFAVRCVKMLLDYGCLAEQEHSLARLLTVVKSFHGKDKHAEIDYLIGMANALCQQAVSKPQRMNLPLVSAAEPARLQTIKTPRAERQPTVFLSYANADRPFANQLMTDLRAAGHACWIDNSSLKGGDEWLVTIAEGILNSYAVVVVVTPSALQSRWVQDEILWARKKNKIIIPVLLADVINESRFFPLAGYQAVNFLAREYQIALADLLRALPSLVPLKIVGETVPVPDNSLKFATVNSPTASARSVPRTIELAYLERLKLEELLNTEKYTPLAGSSQQQMRRFDMRAVFELMPTMNREHKEITERRRFENAVEELRRLRRAVLLGEPGSGKTTTIWKLTAELVNEAIADYKAPLPLLIRLGRWTDAEQPLHEFIAAQLGDLGAYLDVLLNEHRAALLLDGLNEIPASQHKDKYPQVQRFIAERPSLLAVLSCRELDYIIDLGFDRINITLLDPLRILDFVTRYLGGRQGETFFWRLAGETSRELFTKFMSKFSGMLDEPERVFWTSEELPMGIVWGDERHDEKDRDNTYWKNWLRLREQPTSLMVLARNPYMLLMLTSVYAEQGQLPDNRGELFKLFVQTLLKRERIADEEQVALTDGLARVAFEMQTQRLTDIEVNARTVLPEAEVKVLLDDRLLYLARSANILGGDDQVRFTHQLLQEYFAAQFMDNEMRAKRLRAADIWPPEQWWKRTNWEKPAILLAGLYSNDYTPIVEWLADAQPEVAAQCITRSGAVITEAKRSQLQLILRDKWLPRLIDLKREPQAQGRAAIGRALGQISLDNRVGVGVNAEALPDIAWIEIPASTFNYGDSENEYAAKPRTLTLPTFYISRYPVTYSQYQVFVDADDGYGDARWFEGLAANDDDRGMVERNYSRDFRSHATL